MADTDKGGINQSGGRYVRPDGDNSDSDLDGLSYLDELELGTDPNNRDTDGDGVPDGAEWFGGSDPLDDDDREPQELPHYAREEVTDSDGDGLYDAEELRHGLNPRSKYSEEHGLAVFVELRMGLDPGAADMDEDGLSDGKELAAGTDWRNPDSDGDSYLDGEDLHPMDFGADRDNDGLSDQEEAMLGTSPGLEDTDSDGLLDGDEIDVGTNPLKRDSDNDGLDDLIEVRRGSNWVIDPTVGKLSEGRFATNPDSDGDGLNDGEEYVLRTDWFRADSDDDGIDDRAELANDTLEHLHVPNIFGVSIAEDIADGVQGAFLGGFDAAALEASLSADSDGDGVSDWDEANTWQAAAASDPANAWALADDDGDGVSNLQEAVQGTDPTVPDLTPAAQPSAPPAPPSASQDQTTGTGDVRSLNGQPTPPEPDDLQQPAELLTPAVAEQLLTHGAGDLAAGLHLGGDPGAAALAALGETSTMGHMPVVPTTGLAGLVTTDLQSAFVGGFDGAALEASLSADSDGDGVSDWDEANTWQAAAAADPANAGAWADDDGDGVSNLQEAMQGTDPTVPDLPSASADLQIAVDDISFQAHTDIAQPGLDDLFADIEDAHGVEMTEDQSVDLVSHTDDYGFNDAQFIADNF